MKLELKESNSPFWLIGLNNGKITQGSFTNVPCYYKSSKKQYELAKKIIKEPTINEVYLITGIVWDNMKSSWSIKEAGSYVQNKGKLILSKDEITDYEEKYGSVEYNESKYPKGISRESLPKKGVKTYTSVATSLENKKSKIKPELKIEDALALDSKLKNKFDNLLAHGGQKDFEKLPKNEIKLFAKYVKSLEDVSDLIKGIILRGLSFAHGDDLMIEQHQIKLENNEIKLTFEEFMKLYNEIDADDNKLNSYNAKNYMNSFNINPKSIYDFLKKYAYNIENYIDEEYGFDEDFDIKNVFDNKYYNISDMYNFYIRNYKSKFKIEESINVKESKIVTPVGNPQTAGSFVNIDIDLDHMEISDFIVRLAQAIRSEQNAVLEYVALKSANGVTNEDVTVLDDIIKEEKNHMAAITTLLYKQIIMNHKENLDGANQEFTLPKFGMEIFDNSDDIKLNESINDIIDNVLKEKIDINNVSSTISQDQYSVSVDVNYDLDYIGKLGENLERAIKQLNREFFIKDKYAISETSENGNVDWNLGDTFDFTLLTYNGFDKEVNEEFLRRVCEILFKKASTYEYFIELA